MWTWISHRILKFRLPLIILVAVVTAFMATQIENIKWSYSLASIVPESDLEMQYFKSFKQTFGEDGNTMVLGIKDSSIFETNNFKNLSYLINELKGIDGITSVLSIANIESLEKTVDKKKFELTPVFKTIPKTQQELDSLLHYVEGLKFYSGQLLNPINGASLILINIDQNVLDSKERSRLFQDIFIATNAFERHSAIDLHYAGLPYVRTVNTAKVKKELNMFLGMSVAITALILFLFFRSFNAVAVPLLIIAVIVIWVLGTLGLTGYKITLLTGLIPPLIVVIGIPNSVYMLNRYHQEFVRHGDKIKALSIITRKIGLVTLITNTTTAVGFLVLATTEIGILKEFGIVAGINILATFLVSIILIPSIYSYLAPPKPGHLKHLKFKGLEFIIDWLNSIVIQKKPVIFMVTAIFIALSVYGLTKVKALSYMVDDLSEESEIVKDLRFFEHNFSGVMPLDIVVDTGNKKGIKNLKNLKKINRFEKFLDSIESVSYPISIVSLVKASTQAYYNGNPAYYKLPSKRDAAFIFRMIPDNESYTNAAQSFIDSLGQTSRISLRVADVGSVKMDSLVNQVIRPKITEIFEGSKLSGIVTGTTLIFIKGNDFLIDNLIQSMLLAFLVIAVIMGVLFRNVKIILISVLTNIIPLLLTAGIMGYFGIYLKPSTALIFSIAFGISVDDSIHFLAKYRQELFSNDFNVPMAIKKSIKETGASMIYTSVILFFGFVIFTASDFLGTVWLGLLTSLTLLFAMLTNLTVLPALLLKFDSGKRRPDVHPPIESYEVESRFHHEEDDIEIDSEKLQLQDCKD